MREADLAAAPSLAFALDFPSALSLSLVLALDFAPAPSLAFTLGMDWVLARRRTLVLAERGRMVTRLSTWTSSRSKREPRSSPISRVVRPSMSGMSSES